MVGMFAKRSMPHFTETTSSSDVSSVSPRHSLMNSIKTNEIIPTNKRELAI
jgi:hypothetical protein